MSDVTQFPESPLSRSIGLSGQLDALAANEVVEAITTPGAGEQEVALISGEVGAASVAPATPSQAFAEMLVRTATGIGLKFGRLEIIDIIPGSRQVPRMAVCKCDCGTLISVSSKALTCGETRSCGCLRRETAAARGLKNRRHGHGPSGSKPPSITYVSWRAMHQRCMRPQINGYKDYGGRGITVCDSWMIFDNFLADMGERPSKEHSIDRIDNDGNYEPGNCRWATRIEQARQKRKDFKQWQQNR